MGNHRDPKIEAMFKTRHKLADRGEGEQSPRIADSGVEEASD